MNIIKLHLALGIAFACTSLSPAVTLVSYDFENATARTDPGFEHSSITASSLAYGSQVTAGTTYLTTGENTVMRIRSSELPASTTFGDNYIEFSLTADPGYVVSISSISIDGMVNVTGLYGYLRIRTSANDYGSNVATTQFTSTASSTWTADLSSVAGLADVSSLTFRIYVSQANSSTSRYFSLDNITLSGTVTASSVPEPSSYALLAGGLLLAGVLLRRSKWRCLR